MNELFGTVTNGDLSTIGVLKGILEFVAIVTISLVGFCIVVSSIFKNSVAGLYVSNTRFWDRVHQAHLIKINKAAFGGDGNQVHNIITGIGTVVLGAFPDVKVYTEFTDSDGGTINLDPKGYFLKAIPAMVIYVFIGIMIYYGYPTKIAQKIGTIGTEGLDLFIMNFDPVKFVDNISTTYTKPDFATEDAVDDRDKAIYNISKEVWNKYVGTLTDMKKEMRKSVGNEIEAWVSSNTNEYEDYTDTDKWKMSIEARAYLQGEPDTSHTHKRVGEDGVATFMYVKAMADFSSGSTKVTEDMYIAYVLTFKPIANKKEVTKVKCKLDVGEFTVNAKNGTLVATINTSGFAEAQISGTRVFGVYNSENVQIDIVSTDAKTTFTVSKSTGGKLTYKKGEPIKSISGLSYMYNGTKHAITEITAVAGKKGGVFTSNSDGSTWKFGTDPLSVVVGGSKNTTTSGSNKGAISGGSTSNGEGGTRSPGSGSISGG